MKKATLFFLVFLLFPSNVFAESVSVVSTGDSNVSVNSETKGESTTCINGECTTTGGGSKSKVCVNGKCTESDGNIDISENDGKTQVHIKNTIPTNSIRAGSRTETTVGTNTTNDKETTEVAKKAVKEIQSIRKSLFDQIKAFFKILFPFF